MFSFRPKVSYVIDIAYSGVLAAAISKVFLRNAVLIDTGDAVYELAKSVGNRNTFALWMTKLLEQLSFKVADAIVVRGTLHAEILKPMGLRVEVIPDGVDLLAFQETEDKDLRNDLGLKGRFTVGLVGTAIWSERLQMCYGWELIELIHRMKDHPLQGIMIGNGSGIPHLKELCHKYGIENRVQFLGHIPFTDLPRYLSLMDVCLSTQTNDIPGRVRTTGKLPLYLATQRFVLASNVGEASLVLPPEMLVEYSGVKDPSYPQKLEERILQIMQNGQLHEKRKETISIVKKHFDYDLLTSRLQKLLSEFS